MDMKNKISILGLLIFLSLSSTAQDFTPKPKDNLAGKWNAVCSVEYKNKATIKRCEICPFIIDKNDKSIATIGDLEMAFTDDSLTIGSNTEIETVYFTADSDNHSIKFSYKNKKYKFRVSYIESKIILQDNEGYSLLLTRDDIQEEIK